ncbi:MAG: hypothetical protein QG564_197 [Campylobacterota bacterium]|nr:hypothetical protein [Campylobacterota bacterium]
MLYYYAHTGHKIGLDRMKRAAALLKELQTQGVEVRLLVNDFRAGLAAKEFGIRDSVTIETVQDIDVIAQIGDSLIIDSPEDDRGRLQKYCTEYRAVFRFEQNIEDMPRYTETMLKLYCQDELCISSVIIDNIYFEPIQKKERTLFFLGDADYDKIILSHKHFFEANPMELLLGHYFFVKYEDDLAKIFSKLYEPEEYTNLIRTSSRVITASFQTALEAKASGAEVIYLKLDEKSENISDYLTLNNISVIDSLDDKSYEKLEGVASKTPHPTKNISIIARNIINKITF